VDLRNAPENEPTRRPPVDDSLAADTTTSTGPIAGAVLDLQRSAGNAAVTEVLAPNQGQRGGVTQTIGRGAPAPTSAPPGRAPAVGPATPAPLTNQFAGIWVDLVVRPLGRARERVEPETRDLPAALQEIDTALRGVTSVKNATPKEDPNYPRIEILERSVSGLRDLVQEASGKGKSEDALKRDMIVWRTEAVAFGGKLEWADPSPAAAGDDKGQGGAGSHAGSPAALWKELVVDNLWEGQKKYDESPAFAYTYYGDALLRTYWFLERLPEGNPKRLELYRLQAGLSTTADLIRSRTDHADLPLVDRTMDAFETAAFLGDYLTGKEPPQGVGGPATGGQEPNFTWERPSEPAKDDTALERR
jgi:hypothetical protein